MSATTERCGTALSLLAILMIVSACAEEPLPERRIARDDCLLEMRMDRLDEALRRCDRVVAAYPKDPVPLNERFLIHTLRGDPQRACRDIETAAKLAAAIPPEKLDPLLRNDLRLRSASCRD